MSKKKIDKAVQVPVIEIHQPYNQAVDLLQKAFVSFNEKLCKSTLTVVPVITIQSKGRRAAYGWFWDNIWKNGTEKTLRPEINIAAEHLSRTAVNILETLIHEMAHMINAQRGIPDCNASQYHNRKFKATAEEVGLICVKMGSYGFAKTSLGPIAKEVVDDFIKNNDCTVFNTLTRVVRQRVWQKVFTIPCGEDAKDQVDRLANQLNLSQKEVVNVLLSSYNNLSIDAKEEMVRSGA